MKRLQNAAANRVGISQLKLAKKFGVAQSIIHYNWKKLGLKYYKRQKAPDYLNKQLEQVPKNIEK